MLQRIKKQFLHYSWVLAYGSYDESIIYDGLAVESLHFIKNPYRDKWFADPFILRYGNDTIEFLVEEFDKSVKRGRIAHIIVDRKTDCVDDCKIILDLPTHLSFPAIYRVGDKIYVHPENFKSGKSYIYEYDTVNERLVNPSLISNEPLTDAVIVNRGHHYEILSTYGDNPNGNVLKVLKSSSFLGRYEEEGTLYFCHNSARMAGYMIKTTKEEIRPAQLCEGAYGKAVLFYKDDVVIGCLKPWGKYDGLHTFNIYNDLFVIDLKKYDFPWIYRLKNKIR